MSKDEFLFQSVDDEVNHLVQHWINLDIPTECSCGWDKPRCLSELHGLKPCGNEPCTCIDTPHTVRADDEQQLE